MSETVPADRTKALGHASMLIGGEWVEVGSAGTESHIDPSTGRAQGTVAMGGAPEIDAAVSAAVDAQPGWAKWDGSQRRRALQHLEALIQRETPEFQRRTVLELGTPLEAARKQSLLAAEYFGYYAGWCDKLEGATIPFTPNTGLAYTLREPYGVVGIIITWNGPLTSIGMKVAPALAAGNCVVLKSPELAPYAAEHFARLTQEAGLPAGVFNLVCGGPAAGQRLVEHPDVAKVSCTGGRETARKIIESTRANLTPLVLELGGKSPNLVFADCDLGAAISQAIANGIVAGSGQGCQYPTRMLVERAVYGEAVERLAVAAAAVRVGDPWAPETQMGPVISSGACRRILGMVDAGVARGEGRVAFGGSRLGGQYADGFFVEPTVVVDVERESDLAREEIFGPVMVVLPFDDEDHAVALANDVTYGLAAYVQSRDIGRVNRLVRRLQVGTVHVNGKTAVPPSVPFGGYKQSGYGREGGWGGLEEFLQTKTVFVIDDATT
jgi:acyl-CoA reductase-like NAD-dependent aldehyde dehydrogenase